MSLTDLAAKRAKPKKRDYKLAAEKGLYLLVRSNGAKYWRLKYRFAGKEKALAFGVYPEVSLSEAVEQRDEARRTLKGGQDPSIERKKDKLKRHADSEATFEVLAREWIAMKSQKWKPRHTERVTRSLELDVFPYIGGIPINQIDSVLLRSVLDPIQKRGALDIASRVRQRCSSVFKYGMVLGACSADHAEPLKVVMVPPVKRHFAALTAKEMPEFLTKVHAYNCNVQTRLAVRLLMLTFVRTVELIGARWDEIDYDEYIWNIPAERMKEERPHFVPLARQSLDCLEQLHAVTGQSELLFPKRGSTTEPMSNSTILRVIERIGYKGRMTGHGFRSVASTILNESGLFDFDAIERQLSHEDRDDVRAAYNRAKYMGERRKMMQWWADKVDSLERPSQIVYPDFKKIRRP
jgi:integrase|tara:strand:+ start:6243 stop:7466 length:1224 start_codon:yes stop_codon:yes gene_type:complete